MVRAELGAGLLPEHCRQSPPLRAAPAGKASGCCIPISPPLISAAAAWADDSLIDG